MSAQPCFSKSAPSLSAWIAAARLALGLTQQQFGACVDAHWVTVSKWERAHTQPGKRVIARIEALLQERGVPSDADGEATSAARWNKSVKEAVFGGEPIFTPAYDAFLGIVAKAGNAADPLDAIRDDLGEALGLLKALITLNPGQPTDIADPVQCVASACLEKVTRAFERVRDVWEQQP